MSGGTRNSEDEVLDVVLEDERASTIAQLREHGLSDDEQSRLSRA